MRKGRQGAGEGREKERKRDFESVDLFLKWFYPLGIC